MNNPLRTIASAGLHRPDSVYCSRSLEDWVSSMDCCIVLSFEHEPCWALHSSSSHPSIEDLTPASRPPTLVQFAIYRACYGHWLISCRSFAPFQSCYCLGAKHVTKVQKPAQCPMLTNRIKRSSFKKYSRVWRSSMHWIAPKDVILVVIIGNCNNLAAC